MNKTILSSLLAVAAIAPFAAQAADGTITFAGQVTSQTCTINGGTPNLTITMPKVPTTALAAAGQAAGAVSDSIKINLTACNPNSGGARAFFESGPTVDATTRRLKNATGAGNATNVQVGVTNPDGTDVAIGSAAQGTTYVPITSGAATLVYGSKYVATGVATAGTVNTSVMYSIDFQ